MIVTPTGGGGGVVCVRVRAYARARSVQVVTAKNAISLPDAVARLVTGGACPALGARVTLVLLS
jgi:hypothetical protein